MSSWRFIAMNKILPMFLFINLLLLFILPISPSYIYILNFILIFYILKILFILLVVALHLLYVDVFVLILVSSLGLIELEVKDALLDFEIGWLLGYVIVVLLKGVLVLGRVWGVVGWRVVIWATVCWSLRFTNLRSAYYSIIIFLLFYFYS